MNGYGSSRYGPFGYSSNNSYGRGFNGYRRRGGPYQALTNGARHENPIYPKPEVKFIDFSSVSTSVDSAGLVFQIPLNDIPQGIDGSDRIGQSVSIKNCGYRVNIDQAITGALPSTVRIMLIWDKQPNGAVPAVTDVLQTANFNSFLNTSYRERFTVLRNDYISLSPEGSQTVFIERFVKINMLAQYTDGALPTPPAVANTTGALWLLFISDQPTILPLVTFTSRVRFVDC